MILLMLFIFSAFKLNKQIEEQENKKKGKQTYEN